MCWILFLCWLAMSFGGVTLPCLALPSAGEPPVYRISGVVVSSRDGLPVPFSRLDAVLGGTQAPVGISSPGRGMRGDRMPFSLPQRTWEHEVVADAHGRFSMDLPSAGAWQLTAGGRGIHRQHFEEHEFFFSSIVLTAAKPAAEITIRVDPDATISGLVLDEAGEAVQGAQIWVEFAQGGTEGLGRGRRRQTGFAQTDDRGRYEITGLAPGAYLVRIEAHPWYAQVQGGGRPAARQDPSLDVIYEGLWYPGATDVKGAETIRLRGGEERQADFHLASFPAAHLRVEPAAPPAAGEIRPRSQRSVVLTKISPERSFSQTMNGDGADFGALAPGVYEVETRGDDGQVVGEVKEFRILPGASGAVDWSGGAALTAVKVQIEGVEEGQVGPIIFTNAATGETATAGRADGGYIRGMRQRQAVETGSSGARQVRSVYLLPGTYEVRLGRQGPNFITGLKATGAETSGLLLEVGANAALVTVVIANGKAVVSGVAKVGAGPVQGAMVLLVPAMLGEPGNASEIARDQTNSDGSFEIAAVIPGRYILLAIDHGWDVNWRDPQTLAGYLARGVPLEVDAGVRVSRTIEAVEP